MNLFHFLVSASVLLGAQQTRGAKKLPELVKVPGADYWVAKCEVTQAQYEEIAGENPSAFKDPNGPVDSVSWEDAESYCQKLTDREHTAGRLPPEEHFELPTDAQWDQFAAGTDLKNAATSLSAPLVGTTSVGSHPPNPLGLYDVVGNVWEWCRDWYNNDIRKKDSNKDIPYILSEHAEGRRPRAGRNV